MERKTHLAGNCRCTLMCQRNPAYWGTGWLCCTNLLQFKKPMQ